MESRYKSVRWCLNERMVRRNRMEQKTEDPIKCIHAAMEIIERKDDNRDELDAWVVRCQLFRSGNDGDSQTKDKK